MGDSIDSNRRRFLGTAAMTMAAAQLGVLATAQSNEGASRQVVALGGAKGWLNTTPLSTATLSDKVVLVQFGTYTCINWLRTLPYIRAWHDKYKNGLILVGVHTPEFPFEKHPENVRRAIRQLGINHPIAIDSDYAIWNAFDNRYWPALYFIDARGRLRHHHFGEGQYTQSEVAIQRLLTEAGTSGVGGAVSVAGTGIEAAADWDNLKSPEIYLGHDRATNFSSPGGGALGRSRVYAAPARLGINEWALSGEWTMANHLISLSRGSGHIVCRFHARDVHLVMGPPRADRPIRFRVTLDSQRQISAHGADVNDSGTGTVADQRLYQLIRQDGPIIDRTLEVEFLDAGVEAFAFTFG